MAKIRRISGREILDSRGNPTIEVDVQVGGNIFTASVPSGASTGNHEALELRDGDKRFFGKGVRKAINNLKKIEKVIKGVDCGSQEKIDRLMLDLDKTDNKRKLGANAILGVSLACARAGAFYEKEFLFGYLAEMFKSSEVKMPRPFFNVINGGKHAGNKLGIQEFMVSPKARNFKEALMMGSEVYHILECLIEKKYGKEATNVGDEGGFAPPLRKAEEALDLLTQAIRKAGYFGKIEIAMDCAASDFYVKKRGKEGYYQLHRKFSKKSLLDYYLSLVKKYKIISIEDPFEEEDFESFAELREKSGIQIVGDDLTVTNVERIEVAIREKSCNCLLLKVNQIGTLTEALQAARMAMNAGWKVMVSHRSGETEDDFIADLAVGIGCGQIKAGAPCRGERTAKYNQLLRIEEVLKEKS